jgi:hypothetical protein
MAMLITPVARSALSIGRKRAFSIGCVRCGLFDNGAHRLTVLIIGWSVLEDRRGSDPAGHRRARRGNVPTEVTHVRTA